MRIVLLLLLTFFIIPATALAQEEGTQSGEVHRIIRERIEQTLQERSPSAPRYIGALGSLTRVNPTTFSITDVQGRDRTVQVGSDTQILSNGRTTSLQDLSINSGVVAIGTAVDETIIEARRVLVRDSEFTENRRVYLGTITQRERTSLSIAVRGVGDTESFTTNNRTVFEDITGTTISANDVEVDQAALVIVTEDGTSRIVTKLRLLAPVAGANNL